MTHTRIENQLRVRNTGGGLLEELRRVEWITVTADDQSRRCDLRQLILEVKLILFMIPSSNRFVRPLQEWLLKCRSSNIQAGSGCRVSKACHSR